MANKIDLSGRNAVVTGGAQGIGRAITERFLDSGAAVAIWDRDAKFAEKTAQELNSRGKVVTIACDVTNLTDVERARDDTVKALGRIDILVNNAGIAGKEGNPNASAYSVSKAGVIALPKSRSRRLSTPNTPRHSGCLPCRRPRR